LTVLAQELTPEATPEATAALVVTVSPASGETNTTIFGMLIATLAFGYFLVDKGLSVYADVKKNRTIDGLVTALRSTIPDLNARLDDRGLQDALRTGYNSIGEVPQKSVDRTLELLDSVETMLTGHDDSSQLIDRLQAILDSAKAKTIPVVTERPTAPSPTQEH